MRSILIVGLGSYNGDDQIGWIAVEELTKKFMDDPRVKFSICDRTGFEWMTFAKGAQNIVFVDAIQSSAPAGTIHRIEITAGEMPEMRSGLSSHGLDAIESISIAQALGDMSAEVVFWGIELEQVNCQVIMSAVVQSSIEQLVDRIGSELNTRAVLE